jgi:hypothetical protein
MRWLIPTTVALALALTVGSYADDEPDGLDLPIDGSSLRGNHPPPVKPPSTVASPSTSVPPSAPTPPNPPAPTAPLPPPEPPPSFYGHDISAAGKLIYVIDISGSMASVDATGNTTRLQRAQREISASIRSLPRSFRFNAVAYDCSYYICFEGAAHGSMPLHPADTGHVSEALAWVDHLKPQGATGTGPAMWVALQNRENHNIILLTDGAPNCGAGDGDGSPGCLEAHLSQVRCANTQGARVDVFGISAWGEYRDFCIQLSSQSGGSYTDVR